MSTFISVAIARSLYFFLFYKKAIKKHQNAINSKV